MKGEDPLREFLAAYLAEADEHLSTANERLLTIDAAQRSGTANPRALRDLFRGLHTIKGLSAMVGVDPVVDIAHAMESALRSIDQRGGAANAHAVELFFYGLREISSRVRSLAAGAATVEDAPGDLVQALEAVASGAEPAPRAATATLDLDPALAAKLVDFERKQIAEAVRDGRSAVRIDFAPSAAKAEAGITINRVRGEIEQLGEIVRVLPVARPGGVSFAILAVTDRAPGDIAKIPGLDEGAISYIARPAATTSTPPLAPEPALDAGAGGDAIRTGTVRVDVKRLDGVIDDLAVVVIDRLRIDREVANLAARGLDVRELRLLLTENARHLRTLRTSILNVRMIPIGEVLDRLPLLVRGLHRNSGKTVQLDLHIGRAEVDKGVAERIFPALMHLVRNAVDHGIESAEKRTAVGKPANGTVRVVAADATANWIDLEIGDDGSGIDREALAQRAGKPVPRDDAQLVDLLCTPGLSTRTSADATSGRGMGMDIVRRIVVDELGGSLAVRSELGRGTTFTMRIPSSVSIIDTLVVESAAQRFAIPLATVEEIVEVSPTDVTRTPMRRSTGVNVALLARRGQAMPFVSLAALLRHTESETTLNPRALVVQTAAGRYAIGVERLLGQQEAVVKPMDDLLVRIPGVIGATQLGDGQPTLMLDLVTLALRSRSQHPNEVPS